MAASREHQGLIISLIIFVMLTVVLGAASYLLYSRDEEATAKVDAAEEKRKEWRDKAIAAQGNLNNMKKMLGFTEDAPDKKIQEKWEDDMKVYKAVYPEEGDLNYSKLIGYLASEIRKQDDQIRSQAVAIGNLDVQMKAAEKSHVGEIAKLAGSFKVAQDDLTRRTLEFSTNWNGYITKQDAAARLFDQNKKDSAAIILKREAERDEANAAFVEADRLLQAFKNQANKQDKFETEVADGRITSTNQTTDRVYINLGRADSLRPQITFSVHGRNVANVAKAKPKAKIIVTRLLSDPHMAEARVVEEDIANPIIRGDRLFTPAWSPGRKIRFAFAGTVDMDGDGRGDMRRIRDLVAINNGIVDASPDENGNMVGMITTNTRYLVVGEAKLKNNAAIDARSAAIDQARANGVEQLSVVEFLDMMGWKNSRRTITLGRGAKAFDKSSDFKPRRP